jgi:hypothetical protein
VLILVPVVGSRPLGDRGGDQGEGVASMAFIASMWAFGLAVVEERERRGSGEGATGTAFSWARVTKVAWRLDTRFCLDV